MSTFTTQHSTRRGALLLVVLSMLILFLMLGSVLVTHATRSRTAATSFATAVAATSNTTLIANDVLDEALMQLIRGKPNPDPTKPDDESILGDKYSTRPAIKGNATITNTDILLEATFTPHNASDITHYLDLGGRILTFLPTPSQKGTVSSYRILRAESSTAAAPGTGPFKCYLANIRSDMTTVLPDENTQLEAVINSKEFPKDDPSDDQVNPFAEPYDSFDQDTWLTQYTLTGTSAAQPVIIQRSAFQKGGSPSLDVDNDNDGVPDSEWKDAVWKNSVFPDHTLPNGHTLTFDVSYLVYDLDARFNVNAHGSLDRSKKTISDYGTLPQEISDEDIQPGFGWGVADMHLPLGTSSASPERALVERMSTGLSDAMQSTSFVRQTKLPPLDGRYGRVDSTRSPPDPTPSDGASTFEETGDNLFYQNNRLVDLKSIMMLFVDSSQSPPSLEYRLPSGYTSATIANNLTADPYEIRIGSTTPRINAYRNTNSDADNLFSFSELERVLRQYDADATNLPQRLASLLDNQSQDLRMLITTDSWDTPALTGEIVEIIFNFFKNHGPTDFDKLYELLSPDIVTGMRFDLNRPFDSTSAANRLASKQDFCRHLYCLLIALEGVSNSATATADHERIAQWVVNAADYRDTDSRSTLFTFDSNLSDGWGDTDDGSGLGSGAGWDATANVKQGNEKTTLALAETYAYYTNAQQGNDSGLFVSLYRPAEETITFQNGTSVAVGQLDAELQGSNGNLDLCKHTNGGDPIWRLRYTDHTGGDAFVRFDIVTLGNLKSPFNGGNTSYRDASTLDKDGNPQTFTELELPPDGFICVYPSVDAPMVNFAADGPAPNVFKTLAVDKGKKMGFLDANSSNNYDVHLERLANPAEDYDSTSNPYVTMNSFPVKPVSKNGNGVQNNGKSYRRCEYHFWKTPGHFETQFQGNFGPLPRTGRGFLTWPNRPFISNAELALVPYRTPDEIMDGDNMLSIGDRPYHYLSDALTNHPERALDALYVSSRFRGTTQSFDTTKSAVRAELAKVGMNRIPYRQFSRYREPGKININTMPMADYGSNALAKALIGSKKVETHFGSSGSFSNPFYSNPRTTEHAVFGLGSTGISFDSVAPSGNGNGGGGNGNQNCNGNCNAGSAYTDQRDYYPLLGLRTAIRLGNTATIRSSVFGVWITVKVTDQTTTLETKRRLFAIVDRSIPTAFSPGEDLNTRNVIRLKRFIE